MLHVYLNIDIFFYMCCIKLEIKKYAILFSREDRVRKDIGCSIRNVVLKKKKKNRSARTLTPIIVLLLHRVLRPASLNCFRINALS